MRDLVVARLSTPQHTPLVRGAACLSFFFLFFKEFLLANWQVLRAVLLQKRSDWNPAFIEYSLEGLSPAEIFLLTHCITLTPGTCSVELGPKRQSLIVHALEGRDAQAVQRSIFYGLERPLLRWTR